MLIAAKHLSFNDEAGAARLVLCQPHFLCDGTTLLSVILSRSEGSLTPSNKRFFALLRMTGIVEKANYFLYKVLRAISFSKINA
jgi:hypothetical protein